MKNILLVLIAASALSACVDESPVTVINPTVIPAEEGQPSVATAYCMSLGGVIVPTKISGKMVNMCDLPDGNSVDEWALYDSAN